MSPVQTIARKLDVISKMAKPTNPVVNITTPAGPMTADEAMQMMQDAVMDELEPALIRVADSMLILIDAANRFWDSIPWPVMTQISGKERKRERYLRRYRNIGRRKNG